MAKKQTEQASTPSLEWIAAIVGLLLILVLVSIIGRQAISGQVNESPEIVIRMDAISPTTGGYAVTFSALNRTDSTAVSLNVEGTLKKGASLVERSSTTFDYLPGHGWVSGGFFFRQDPRRYAIAIRATSFQKP